MPTNEDKNIYEICDAEWVRSKLPKRKTTANKGSFGKAMLIVGSDAYRGAAYLSLGMALRGGAGYVSFLGEANIAAELRAAFPEAIYYALGLNETEKIFDLADKHTSILVGSGSGVSEELYALISALISREGGPLIIDADGLNSIAKYAVSVKDFFNSAKRTVVLTPHPLELSRLSGLSVSEIESARRDVALRLAGEWGVILLLKGFGTVITDGKRLLVNSSGSVALAKAGSGDVLAGLIVSVASYTADTLFAAGISAYLHGAAGDRLAEDFTEYGVTPSDLPKEVAKALKKILNGR